MSPIKIYLNIFSLIEKKKQTKNQHNVIKILGFNFFKLDLKKKLIYLEIVHAKFIKSQAFLFNL